MGIKLLHLVENDRRVEHFKTLFEKNPNIFLEPNAIRIPFQLNLFDFTLEITPDELDRYLDGDWAVRKYTNKEGRTVTIGFFETVMSGDAWELYDSHGYDGDWESVLDYHINDENESKIKEIINKMITDNGYDLEDFADSSLQDLINDFDNDDEIKSALRWSLSDAESNEYVDYCREQIRSALEEIGNVTEFNDESIKIEIPLSKLIPDYFNIDINSEDPNEFDEFLDWLDGKFELNDSENIFGELFYDGYSEKPSVRLNDRWYPDINDKEFNMILSDRISDINY